MNLRFGQRTHVGHAENFVLEIALARIDHIALLLEPIMQRLIACPPGR